MIAATLGALPLDERSAPAARVAMAVLARTGDLDAAVTAHRHAADVCGGDPELLGSLLGSCLGLAFNRGEPALFVELLERGEALASSSPTFVSSLREIVLATAEYAAGQHAAVERRLVAALAADVPGPLRGPLAFLRAMALQSIGLLDASVQAVDSEQAWLGLFDLPAEFVRARRHWVEGDHDRARSLLHHALVEARSRGRQHDGDYAAALLLAYAAIDGRACDVTIPAPSTPQVADLLSLASSFGRLPDEAAAAARLSDRRPDRNQVVELSVIARTLQVLAEGVPHDASDDTASSAARAEARVDPSGVTAACAVLLRKRRGDTVETLTPFAVRNMPAAWRAELTCVPTTSDPRDLTELSTGGGAAAPTVCVLGSVRLRTPEGDLPIRRERVRALLAILAVHRRMSRDRLIDLLWPDKPMGAGANNLRATLSYTRALSPGTLIRSEGRLVELAVPTDLSIVDRVSSSTCVDGDALVDAARMIAGRFAEDVADASWLDGARFGIDATSVEVLLAAAEGAAGRVPSEAREFAARALEIDPWSERAWRVTADAWRASGDTSAAARAASHAEALARGLGVG